MAVKYKPYYNVGPGPFIKEELAARNWRQKDLAEIIGMSLKSINQLIKNKQSITVETAQLLSKAFGQSPQFWINLDTNYRIRLKQDKKRTRRVGILAEIFKYMPIKEIIQKGWIKKYKNPDDLRSKVCRFWGIQKLDFSFLDEAWMPNLRKSQAYNQFNEYHAYTWFKMAQKCAEMYSSKRYSIRKLKQISDDFASYTTQTNGIKKFLRDISQTGIKFFVLSHLQKTYIDGASFYDKRNPVIVYTKRYNRIDNFWYTIAHEIAHILLHLRKESDAFIDDLENLNTAEEQEADKYALQMIKADEIKEYFKSFEYISEYRVNDCAEEVGVSPALVVGVLQHEGKLSRRNLNRLKEPVANEIPRKYWAENYLNKLRKVK